MFRRPTQQRTPPARTRFFGLFAAVWVGLALQPCAIAAVSDHDCPHCPQQADEAPAAHETHCDPAVKVTPDVAPGCDAVQADCCNLEKGAVNVVRVDDTNGDDQPTGLVATEPVSHPDPRPCENPGIQTGPPEPSGGSVPLHVLKCVYLK